MSKPLKPKSAPLKILICSIMPYLELSNVLCELSKMSQYEETRKA